MYEKHVLVLIGPSGVGKSSIVRRLAIEGLLDPIVTWTTRPQRDDEQDGSVEHIFVSESAFKMKEDTEKFLGTVQLFGLPYKYGLPKPDRAGNSSSIRVVLLRASLIKPCSEFFKKMTVYQIESEKSTVQQRLGNRETNYESMRKRLSGFDDELTLGRSVADRIFINDDLLETVTDQVREAIGEDFEH